MAEARSKIYTLDWKIENLSYFTLSEKRPIESPSFFPYGIKESRQYLKFYPRNLLKFINTPMADKDDVVLSVANFGTMRNRSILCRVEARGKDYAAGLRKIHPHLFVLPNITLQRILMIEDTVTFKCEFDLPDLVDESRKIPKYGMAVSKSEIHTEFFKTTMNLQHDKEKTLSLVSSHFTINVIVFPGELKVSIEQNESERQRQKIRYLNGKFLFVAREQNRVISFEAAEYLNLYDREGSWSSKNFKDINDSSDFLYFSCDIKTGGMQTGYFKNYEVALQGIPAVKDHLRYVSATKEYPDIVIKVEGKNIAVHEVILTSKSSYFATLIKENESCIIEIKDYDLKTAIVFLDFLYYGKLEKSKISNVNTLLQMAEFYQVDTLVAECINLRELANRIGRYYMVPR